MTRLTVGTYVHTLIADLLRERFATARYITVVQMPNVRRPGTFLHRAYFTLDERHHTATIYSLI